VERLMEAGVDVFPEAGEIHAHAIAGGVGQLFIEGCGETGAEGESGVTGYAVVDVMAEAEGQDEGLDGAWGGGLGGEGFLDFGDGGVCGVGVHVTDDGGVTAQADGRVLEVEIDHGEAGKALEEGLVLFFTHGGDVGEAIVVVDEVGVRVWGVEGAGEDVEECDAVAGGEPVGDGEGEREGSVIAVRREHEDVQSGDDSVGSSVRVLTVRVEAKL
jgi:hypothetical protein